MKAFLTTALLTPTLCGFNLFDPVPSDQMRELSADRPDATESAITVDAGHIQIEASLYNFAKNDDDESHLFGAINFKLGLTDHSDLQFVFDSYLSEDLGTGGGSSGFGDLTLRYKHNLWGNDGGDSSLALFPFVKIPTGGDLSNDEWEGGLIVPYGTTLSNGVGLGLMAEFDYVFDEDSQDHELEFLHSAVLGFDLTERLGAFTEYVGIVTEDHYEAYLGGGLTYAVHENLVLDLGTQFGLNSSAEDLSLFTGFTLRL
ncbi:transporter [Roseibacillus persicicus]|uniref:transporter n=1 Tax=Roseibacillus persicicus TaxID=454148 RepID=UPI00398AFCE1